MSITNMRAYQETLYSLCAQRHTRTHTTHPKQDGLPLKLSQILGPLGWSCPVMEKPGGAGSQHSTQPHPTAFLVWGLQVTKHPWGNSWEFIRGYN